MGIKQPFPLHSCREKKRKKIWQHQGLNTCPPSDASIDVSDASIDASDASTVFSDTSINIGCIDRLTRCIDRCFRCIDRHQNRCIGMAPDVPNFDVDRCADVPPDPRAAYAFHYLKNQHPKGEGRLARWEGMLLGCYHDMLPTHCSNQP